MNGDTRFGLIPPRKMKKVSCKEAFGDGESPRSKDLLWFILVAGWRTMQGGGDSTDQLQNGA